VDTERFHALACCGKIEGSILFVGRLEKRKGIGFLIETIPLVKEQMPDVKLFVIGRGRLRGAMERFCELQGLESAVEFLGPVPDHELVRWYNQVQVVVVPSVLEGLGMTSIQAMACGTPVIGTTGSGLTDVIQHGKNGLMVEYGDHLALSRAIVELLRDKGLQRTFSEEGEKAVEKDLSWQAIVEELAEVCAQTG
jgi:glycosyltransferase involved in cell wall biosynthesis